MGDKINTSGDEVTPYITDNNILFYSSNGREDGYGNLDVYATEIFSNIASEPLHLESPVNSINDDFAYIVNSNNKGGFFSSNRLQGQDNNDMYSFIIEDIKPEKCLQQIAGVVKDKETMEIIKDAAMTLFDNDGNQVQQVLTDKNGEYSFDLDCSQTYTLVASSLYYSKEEHIINTANYNRAPELEANKFLSKMTGAELEEALATAINGEQPIKEETKVEEPIEKAIEEAAINDVYFGFDKSNITSESAKELDKLASIMEKNASLNIEVSAYTDARGSSAYNLKLSNRRAKSTIEYLVSKGIERSRISGKGYGESNMVNKCVNGVECSEDAHQKNRRTEITFVNGTAQTFNVNNSKQIIASQNNDVELTNDVNILGTQQIVKKKKLDTLNNKQGLLTSKNKVLNKIDEDKVDTSIYNYLDEDVISSDTNEKGVNNSFNNRTSQELTVNISSDKNKSISDYYIDDGKSNILKKQNNSTKPSKQELIKPDTLEGSNSRNALVFNKHHDKKDAVFENEKEENFSFRPDQNTLKGEPSLYVHSSLTRFRCKLSKR